MKRFTFIRQLDAMDCGPSCLAMIINHYGKNVSLPYLRDKCEITRNGVSLKGITKVAEELNFRVLGVKLRYYTKGDTVGLIDMLLPCIAHYNQNHFVVIYKINSNYIWIADPAQGKLKLSREQFEKAWCSDGDKGIVLALEPMPEFFSDTLSVDNETNHSWSMVLQYLRPYRKLILQFIIGILAGLILQIIFPFLTQSLIDVGVQNQNINFIWLILFATLILFLCQTFIQFIQSWILLQIGKRINVHLISDFLSKLAKLPLGYFDSKNIGDIIQRINDNHRIEEFLTGSVLSIFFSFLSLIVFSVILLFYNITIFLVFAFFSFLYIVWILSFMKKRAQIDYMSFQKQSENQLVLYEMVNGMQEMKLQGSEQKRRWKWIDIQGVLFRFQSKSLSLRQYQDFGAIFFLRLKDIIISFLAAKAVIEGSLTLGTLVSIQYIVGQLNVPFDQFIQFLRSAQDAKLSLKRMSEITTVTSEESINDDLITQIPLNADIIIDNLSFRYHSTDKNVLKSVSVTIPHGKVTAIVGVSGTGKTTLLKLLLGFYPPSHGRILIGNIPLNAISKTYWRSKCGTVMQEGFIFSDTIANNIAESDSAVDYNRLQKALNIANISNFISVLPLTYNTVIGASGMGLSQGQKQRLLIARAVYKNPDYLLFDEATNALDATNEKVILENLKTFYVNKTVVVIAHRLSTVKGADQIIVIDDGKVAEIGTHSSLVSRQGIYYTLVQDQLDLEQRNNSFKP